MDVYRDKPESRRRWKVIRTRHITEVYEFAHVPHCAGGRKREESVEADRHRRTANKRRRDYVRRLIAANFGGGDKFITLTFRENLQDVQEAYRAWKAFRERLRRRWPEFRAVAVVEFQKRGAVHYHMICDLPYVRQEELEALWGHGFVSVMAVDHVDNVGAYLVKYMTKTEDDRYDRLRGLKSYYRVGKLVEPEVSWEDRPPALEDAGLLVWESVYQTDYHGTIRYSQYNRLRRHSGMGGTGNDKDGSTGICD